MKLFSKVKNVEDIKKVFFDNYDNSLHSYALDVVESGLKSLDNLDDKTISKFIKYCGSIDNYFGSCEDEITIRNKLKTMLSTSMILDKNYQETEKLTEKEFLTLAFFLSDEEPCLMDNYTKLYDKEILQLLCSKFIKYSDRQNALYTIDMKVCDMELNNHEGIIKYINNIKVDNVVDLAIKENQSVIDNHGEIRGVLK